MDNGRVIQVNDIAIDDQRLEEKIKELVQVLEFEPIRFPAKKSRLAKMSS